MQSSYTATICFHTVATNSHVTEQINRKFKVPNSGDFSGDSGDSDGDSGDFGDSGKSCDPYFRQILDNLMPQRIHVYTSVTDHRAKFSFFTNHRL